MNAIWKGATLLAVCCILLHRPIVAQDKESDEMRRVSQFDNATLIWSVREIPFRLAIMNASNKTIISFVSGFLGHRDPRVVEAGDRNTTFGFTLPNVNLSEAGEYRCRYDGKSCGRITLYILGRPERGRVIQYGKRLRCHDVEVTSQPEEHRPPADTMVYKWHQTELLPTTGPLNNTVPDPGMRIGIVTPDITPNPIYNGSYFTCSGKEKRSLLWSDNSEWYQYVFYGPRPTVPGERNNASSPNVTDTGKDEVLDIEPGTKVFIIIVSLVSLSTVLLLAVIIAVAILCRRKKSTEVNQNATNNHQMAAKSHEQYSDEEDSTVLVDNTEYSDNNYFGSDSGLGEYSDIREIERLRIKDRGPAPLPQNENIYELQESVQVSDEHKAKLDNQDDEDEERIVTDIYAVPMKKGTLK